MSDKIITLDNTKWVERPSGLIVPMTETEKHMKFYTDNYDFIAKYSCNNQDGHKIFIDNTVKKPYRCRFCGKTEPEVQFSDNCHAISELIGNKTFFLKSECESCNKRFGKIYEDQFAKYLGPARTLTQTRGKNGVPSYKSVDGKFRMDVTDKGVVIQEISGNNKVDFKKPGEISFKLPKDTYVPLMVFKALIFMALSIMPENELSNFTDTIDWINEGDRGLIGKEQSKYNMCDYSSHIVERFIAGAKPLPLSAVLLRRKAGKKVPYCIFALEFDNYGFQIIVPCIGKDAELVGHTINFPFLPLLMDTNEQLKNCKKSTAIKDWSSNKPVKGEILTMNLCYDYQVEITGRYANVADMAKQEGVKPLKPNNR